MHKSIKQSGNICFDNGLKIIEQQLICDFVLIGIVVN